MNLFPKNRNFDGKDLSNQVFEMDGLGNTWVCHPDIDEKGQDFDRCSFVGANLSGTFKKSIHEGVATLKCQHGVLQYIIVIYERVGLWVQLLRTVYSQII